MRGVSLDRRLLSAAEFVRQGAILADIGTDHAYLPVFLLMHDRIERAVLSDINEGPLESARHNAEEHGLLSRVELILSDGAASLAGKGITDYAICGMGGELIARIIEDAPHLCDKDIRLILQPMSRHSTLRRELARLGFTVRKENYSYADGKYYVCMLAEYSGEPYSLDHISAELGIIPDEGRRAEYVGYLEVRLRAVMRALYGKRASGAPVSEEAALAAALTERIRMIKEG